MVIFEQGIDAVGVGVIDRQDACAELFLLRWVGLSVDIVSWRVLASDHHERTLRLRTMTSNLPSAIVSSTMKRPTLEVPPATATTGMICYFEDEIGTMRVLNYSVNWNGP